MQQSLKKCWCLAEALPASSSVAQVRKGEYNSLMAVEPWFGTASDT